MRAAPILIRLFFCWTLIFTVQAGEDGLFKHPKIISHLERQRVRKDAIQSRLNILYSNPMRLPSTLVANHYDIHLKPYYPAPGISYDPSRNFTFDGDVSMQVTVVASTNVFVVNANRLNFSSITVTDGNGNNLNVGSTSFNGTSEQLTITPSDTIQTNANYTINFKYTGTLSPYYTAGFFYTYYTDLDGNYHWMVATQMEPFDARAVFPGLDEPAYKATFNISMTYPEGQVVLGNMPDKSITSLGDGWAMVNFDTTPIMSTYLIAVAVGPFVSANYTNDVGTIARAWGWTGQEAYLQFSAEVAGKCLYQLGVYTNFTYPLPKSDNLGLPQFPAGAMENWGLVIYAYDDLVFNPNTMTTDDMERCIIVICHELTHQWFGDLITMAWWSDLFLNEGFAEYFESFIQTKVYPEQFDYIDAAVVKNDVQGALRYDVSNGAHPIIDPNGPYFDTITYNKGASMLRMTQDVLGEDVMREGLQNYVQKFQYSNALHPDLFDEFDKVSQKYSIKDWCGNTLNVTHFLEPYFHQSNFPLINYSNAAFFTQPMTSQSPWKNVSSLQPSEFNYEWDIPLRTLYYYQRNANTAEWVTESGHSCSSTPQQLDWPKNRQVQWSVPSLTGTTYGRILYDDVGFSRLIYAIQNEKISPSALIQMLGDEMAIVSDQQAKSLPYSYDRLLTLMRTIFRTPQFVNNPNGPLFEMVMSQIDYFASFFRDSVDAHLMHLFIYEIFGPAYSNLNWTLSNSWATNTFMETFLPYAVRYGLHDAANRTLTMYQNIKAACITSTNGTHWCNPYPPDLHRAIYCGATLYSNEAIDYFGNILNHYNNEVTNNYYFFQEYYALLEGLTCSQRPQDLKVLIRFFVNSKLNSRTIFGWLKYNSVAGDALFNYMMENPDQVLAYGGFSAYMDAMTFNWKSDRRMKQYSQLQNLNFTPDTQATYNSYMDRIGQSINFMNSEFPMTLRWFYDNLVIMSHTPWRVRLDGNVVIPKGYSLIVQPYIPSLTTYMFYLNMTFTGASTMNFTVSQTTDTIRLNAHRIQIFPDYVTLTDSSTAGDLLNGTLVQLSKDYDNAIMTIKFPLTLQTGTVYTLGFNYIGFILNKAASGVDANWNYYEFNDKKGWIFTTDMEMGPALRSLLPCIDEPSYKATWAITLIHPTEMMALSNMPDTGTLPSASNPGWSITSFLPTPPMSSYLVAVVCGHFAYISSISNSGTLVRMVSWAGMEKYGDFTLPFAVGTLNYMSETFQQPYALPKLDILSLPQYSGDVGDAMENWGLIIGEYTAFMVDPDYATIDQKIVAAWTTAHETVHQWFGDLVTFAWFNDLFLNEAFAQYFMWNVLNYTDTRTRSYIDDYIRAHYNIWSIGDDCDRDSKPLRSDTPPLFSYAPYDKGPALLHMIEQTLSWRVFIDGLTNYIQNHLYGNADAYDLWKSLTDEAQSRNVLGWDGKPLNVTDFMEEWSNKVSYPTIIMSQQSGNIAFQQSSCLQQSPPVSWKIPLWVQNSGNEDMNWFYGDSGTGSAWTYPIPTSGFKVINSRVVVPLRVKYDNVSLDLVKKQLTSDYTQIHVHSRMGLLFDGRYFINTGDYTWQDWLDLTMYMGSEQEFGPFEVVMDYWNELLSRFRYDSNFPTIVKYINSVSTYAMQNMQWCDSCTNEWKQMVFSRYITSLSCRMGNSACLNEATNRFFAFKRNCTDFNAGTSICNPIIPDFRRYAYCYGASSEPQNAAPFLYKHMNYFQTKAIYFNRDFDNLLFALSCVNDYDAMKPYLDMAINGQLDTDLIYYTGFNDNSGKILWNYFQSNTTNVVNSPYPFSYFVTNMARDWSTDDQLKSLNDFLTDPNYNYLTDADKTAWQNAINMVTDNRNWLSRNSASIINWITNHIN